MSAATISNLPRITASKLGGMLLATVDDMPSDSRIAIVDVRDDGGHIKASLHFPSRSLDATMPTLLRKLADKEVVVFHCALSQQRGPSAALRYLRERKAASAAATAVKKAAEDKEAEEEVSASKQQQVYILDRGFVGWQELFGRDDRLTEGYREDIWEDSFRP
ncbi:Rhodanese-like protein [Daldinia sp. FL1419]|nr:Rhodanese-like protein [Daldinia sp. FL1419]